MSKPLKESIKQIEAFNYYYEMPRRSYEGTSKQFGVSAWTVGQWALKYNWQQRVDDRAERERQVKEDAYLKKVSERTELHQKSYQLVQGKAVGYLGSKKDDQAFSNGGDAVRALDVGIRGEREMMGLSLPVGTVPGHTINTTNIQNNVTIALSEMAKNGQREVILRSLKRVYKELTAGGTKKTD
jgi:hypothetical protein